MASAQPNSEGCPPVTPSAQNATATNPGSRYGKNGDSLAGSTDDSNYTKIVSAK